MSYKTVEVELDHGRVRPRNGDTLPEHASALLTILNPPVPAVGTTPGPRTAGLERLLKSTDFSLTPEQFRASMEADFWER